MGYKGPSINRKNFSFSTYCSELSDQQCRFYFDEQPIFCLLRRTDISLIVWVNPRSPNGNYLSPIGHQSVYEILLIYHLQAQQQHEIRHELSIKQHQEGKPVML